jgi:hypothetical protein
VVAAFAALASSALGANVNIVTKTPPEKARAVSAHDRT